MPLEAKDYFTLGISSASLLTTIVWNLSNRRHTDRVARKLRGEAFAFDEWKLSRSEIRRTLRALEDRFDEIALLTDTADDAVALKTKLSEAGKALTRAQIALGRELSRAEDAWTPLAFGPEVDGETAWDRVNQIIADIRALDNADAMRLRLPELKPLFDAISQGIEAEVRVRTIEHNPVKV